MLVFEPPRTRYDIHFRLAGFPVRIHPAFWLTTAILGFNSEQFDAVELLLWVVVVFASILVHEMGHALAVRKFGWVSRIVLYHLGGLATIESPREAFLQDDEELPHRSKILIAAAGPLAGFALAGVIIGGLLAAPIHFTLVRNDVLGVWFAHDYDHAHYPEPALKFSGLPDDATVEDAELASRSAGEYARHRRLGRLIDFALYVNIFWGLINLLPVFPLDGGQIARELFCIRHPHTGTEKALFLSTVVGGVVAVLGLLHFGLNATGIFFALMFGILAFINYRVLRQIRAMGGLGGPDDYGGYEPEDWWKR